MKNLISWNVCQKNFVKKVEPDLERVESIKKMAVKRYDRTKKNLDEDVSFLVENRGFPNSQNILNGYSAKHL